ncbi:MAG TPA: demethoxyubiquinone hydroxylase family protein [Longimicrobiales bacterium]|nr:demethoxyubiquinone hydroxylase family protein [Longimicrobiales bacterium]
MENTRTVDATLVARLNDLLQLDHDAVAAYGIAIRELESPQLKTELQAHLEDHERHIDELERHITRIGGMKIPLPHLSGVFKLAVQSAVAAASDRSVLLAFKANEMQVRDKYARAAEEVDMPVDIRDTVTRAADDERRHYDWAVRSLENLGAETGDTDVKATRAFAQVHGRSADAIEAAERGAMNIAERARRAVKRDPVKTLLTAGLAVVGAGAVLGTLLRRR